MYVELGQSISLSFLNRNGWNLVSRYIFQRCLDTQNFSSLPLKLSELSNLKWRYLVISTKSFISLKVQVIKSWNLVCPNIFKKYAWRPNFSQFGWEMTEILREQLGVQKSNLGFQLLYSSCFKNGLLVMSEFMAYSKIDGRIKFEQWHQSRQT